MRPHGQADWHRFAAELNARMALLQIHVQPDWLFALCSGCGWQFEALPAFVRGFRYEVASHRCPEAPEPVQTVPDLQESLF